MKGEVIKVTIDLTQEIENRVANTLASKWMGKIDALKSEIYADIGKVSKMIAKDVEKEMKIEIKKLSNPQHI